MGRLKPRPTFSPHSSRYGTSSRRASVARAHVVVLMGHPVSRNANVLNQKRFLIAPSIRFHNPKVVNGPSPPILLIDKGFLRHIGKPFLPLGQIWDRYHLFLGDFRPVSPRQFTQLL